MERNLVKSFLLILVLVFTSVSFVGCGGSSSSSGGAKDVFTEAMLDANPTYFVTYDGDTEGNTVQDIIAISGEAGAYEATITSTEYDATGAVVSTEEFVADLVINEDGTLTATVGEESITMTLSEITEAYLDVAGTDGTESWTDFWYFEQPAGWLTDDGMDFLYATDAETVIDIVYDTDYTAVDNWGSGAILDNAFAGDADYNPCFAVDNTTAPAWGGLGALAFTGFDAGYFSSYTALHLKFKADTDTAVNIKFPGATVQEEIVYNVASASDLGNGWYDFTIRLANHGDLAATTEFAILASGDFYVTDIYFSSEELPAPAAGDIDGDGLFYLKSGDGNRQIDIRYGIEYQNIEEWSSGTTITDVVDAEFGNIWTMTPGNGWGTDAGAIAFVQFNAGYFSNFTTFKFKFHPNSTYSSVFVQFTDATNAEIEYDLATYGTAVGSNGWYEMEIPMSGHGDVSATTQFAILNFGTSDFSVTDVRFE